MKAKLPKSNVSPLIVPCPASLLQQSVAWNAPSAAIVSGWLPDLVLAPHADEHGCLRIGRR